MTQLTNGLVEKAPFMTIRVNSRCGVYPSPVDFVVMDEGILDQKLKFVHGECGGELKIEHVKTQIPKNNYCAIRCNKCGAEIKMYDDIFWGEVGSLGPDSERWVAGAYQFVKAGPGPWP